MSFSFNPDKAGFAVHNPAHVQQKLARFMAAGADKIHYVLDHDRTLTTSQGTDEDITTWHLLCDQLPGAGKVAYHKLNAYYQAMEDDGLLSDDEAVKWTIDSVALLAQYELSLRQVQTAASRLRLREGTTTLFALGEAAGMPMAILSAGIRDVIEQAAANNRIHPTAVLGCKLTYTPDGTIAGCERKSIIHYNNKREMGHPELSRIRTTRPLTVLIGDSRHDAAMVNGTDDVLRIRVDDHRTRAEDWATYLAASFDAGYDLVARGSDLQPIVTLTRYILTPAASSRQ